MVGSEVELWAVVGPASKDFMSFNGAVIVHTNKDELHWVFNYCRPERFRDYGTKMILLPDYIKSQGLSWPLEKREWS